MSWQKFVLDGHRDVDAGVEVRIPAQRSQLFVIRSLVAAIALRQDFDLDEVEDIKLAVDELCSILVTRASPGEHVRCRFDVTAGSIEIAAAVGTASPLPVEQQTFGWHVLASVADAVTTWVAPGATSPYVVNVTMTKTR